MATRSRPQVVVSACRRASSFGAGDRSPDRGTASGCAPRGLGVPWRRPTHAEGPDVDGVGRRPARSALALVRGRERLGWMCLRPRVRQALANALETSAGLLPSLILRHAMLWPLNQSASRLRTLSTVGVCSSARTATSTRRVASSTSQIDLVVAGA